MSRTESLIIENAPLAVGERGARRVEDARALGSAEAAEEEEVTANELLEVQSDGVKVCGSGDVRDDRVHGSPQAASDTADRGTASAMEGVADHRGRGCSARAADRLNDGVKVSGTAVLKTNESTAARRLPRRRCSSKVK